MTAIWVGIPDSLTLVGNLAFGAWFVGASIGLGRLGAASKARIRVPQPA
jgi:hypothetical protein